MMKPTLVGSMSGVGLVVGVAQNNAAKLCANNAPNFPSPSGRDTKLLQVLDNHKRVLFPPPPQKICFKS